MGQYQANVLRLQAGICTGQWMVEAHRGLPLLHSSVIFQCWCQDHPAKSNHPSSLVQILPTCHHYSEGSQISQIICPEGPPAY